MLRSAAEADERQRAAGTSGRTMHKTINGLNNSTADSRQIRAYVRTIRAQTLAKVFTYPPTFFQNSFEFLQRGLRVYPDSETNRDA